MRRNGCYSVLVLTGLAAGALVSAACETCSAAGQPAATNNTSLRDSERTAFVKEMAEELKLTGEQQTKVLQALEARDADLAAGMASVNSARAAYVAAARSGDRPALTNAMAVLKQAQNTQIEVSRKHTDSILAPLTPEQRNAWQSYQLGRSLILRDFKGCDLSEPQKQKVREMAAAAVGRRGALSPASWQQDYNALVAEVRDTVLNPKQREDLLSYPLYSRVLRELAGANLTPEQDMQLRALCLKEAATATPTNPAMASGIGAFKQAHALATQVQATLLTAVQRDAVAAESVYVTIQHMLTPCGLTAEQLARVRALCGETARATTSDTADYVARNTARTALIENIKATVLTEQQRALVPAMPPRQVLPVSMPVAPTTNRAAVSVKP